MAGKPKAGFWIVMFLVVAALVGYALSRAGFLGKGANAPADQAPGQVSSQADANALTITFYSSSAKKAWVNEMVERFNASGEKAGHVPVRVKAIHVTSGESLDDLKAGRISPDMWSPGDESWLQLAQAYYRDVKQKKLFERYDDLVNIPLVIAIWEPMAKALGYPKPIGWKDVEKLAASANGWTGLGYPQWGRFRWGHAHPDANSGYLTVVSEVYAALGKTSGITPDDLKKESVVTFLRSFEGAVEHYGLSNTWIDDLMHQKGPAYLSACVQYENTIIESNTRYENKPFKLVAVYPTEGMFWTRHPLAILDGDKMTPEKKAACEKFRDFLLSEPAQRKAMEMGLRPIRKDLALAAPFDEAHGVMATVPMDKAFAVPEESVLKRVRDLWEEVKVPATIIMLLDRSGSMRGEPIDKAKQGAVEFIKSMKPRDQIQVVAFNNQVTPLTDLCFIRDCGEKALEMVQDIFASDGTSLYDALGAAYATVLKMEKAGNQRRRYAVLVLSDGVDTSSHAARQDVEDLLPRGEDFDAPKIYTIAYGGEADKELLTVLATKTNARLFSSTVEEIGKTYRELSANF